MAYPSIAPPRERDQVLMDRYLEDFVFNPGSRDLSSSFRFPREVPMREDWNRWFDFWHSFTTTGDKLKVPLGNWINPTHRIWKWYYREDSDDLLRVEGKTMFHYKPTAGFCLTRSNRTYHMTYEEPLSPAMDHGLPILVTGISVQWVIKLSIGPTLATETDTHTGFWEFLHSWGGTWMWEVIEPGTDTPEDVSWIVDGLRNGSLIWTTDGSYDRKRAVDLCGVGWIIFCTNTGFQLTGTFWERSPSASSYRAELLGLCALHLFAQALAEFYTVVGWTAKLCCDNKRALEVSSHHMHRIRPSAKCADIRRSLKAVKPLLSGLFRYVHVYGHMDHMLKWEQLTLTQQLNCVCDTLAKCSVTTAINHGNHDRPTQLPPKEDVALVIWGNKITGDISPHLCFHASKEVARRYLTSHPRDKWSNDRFDTVDWEHLDLALKNKQEMYRIWRSKQHSGFCGTRVQVE